MPPSVSASVRSPLFRAVLLAVLVVTTLASAVLLGWAIASRGESEDVQSQREEVMSVGEQFMLRKETFGPKDLDDQGRLTDYRDRVSEIITSKLETSFDEQTKPLEQLVAKNGLESSSEVYAAAVSGIDEDSADVTVVGDTTFTFSESKAQTAPFRYHLSLVKTDGEWRVDSFDDVSGGQPQ